MASTLSDAQHGFMPKCSCLTNLIVAEELITGMTDQSEPLHVAHLDLSKAFDSVCQRLLVKKMVAMGIHPKITRWMTVSEEQTFKNEIGQPPLGLRYRKKTISKQTYTI